MPHSWSSTVRRLAAPLLSSALLFACAHDDGLAGMQPAPLVVAVPGVTVQRVAIYQGIERDLMKDGAAVTTSEIPLVVNREALVRVFYAAAAPYDGGEVIGRLTVDGGAPIEVRQTLSGTSSQAALGSTLNFRVPGDRVGEKLDLSVAIVREFPADTAPAPEDNAAARWPATGVQTIAVEAPRNVLRLVIAPFSYEFDGSGRVPDLSEAQVEKIRQRFRALYPVSDVTVRVREPQPWNRRLGADGSGWDSVGFELIKFRRADMEAADAYYYGMFNPAGSMQSYCGRGCLLGVTLLNDRPEDTGNPMLRLALGVGFDDVVADTAAHEIGHAHGREHAPCGQGLDQRSIDRDFPHDEGRIGAWGWDLVSNSLRSPDTYTDIMSYCERQFISDYNYVALLQRGRNVNLPLLRVAPELSNTLSRAASAPVEVIAYDGQGAATFHGEADLGAARAGGEEIVVSLGEGSLRETVRGHRYRWDHMPGGWVIVPASAASQLARHAEFVVDGKRSIARR